MPMSNKIAALALAFTVALPLTAEAHRAWMLPSATVLSGKDPWVTVDAAVSNDLFYFEHFPLQLDGLAVIAPDGSPAKAENAGTGRYRSTFDVHLTQPGTYKMAVAGDGLFASYKVDGQQKRWRGTPEKLAEIPANATDLKVRHAQRRLEIFVTAGKPTDGVLKPTGKGLELLPVTHPNDLFAGETARFTLLLDGKPASGIDIEVVPGGNRYRNKLNDMTVKTDDKGGFAVTWPEPGMYWLSADVTDRNPSVPQASERSASYAVTLEVLPQ